MLGPPTSRAVATTESPQVIYQFRSLSLLKIIYIEMIFKLSAAQRYLKEMFVVFPPPPPLPFLTQRVPIVLTAGIVWRRPKNAGASVRVLATAESPHPLRLAGGRAGGRVA